MPNATAGRYHREPGESRSAFRGFAFPDTIAAHVLPATRVVRLAYRYRINFCQAVPFRSAPHHCLQSFDELLLLKRGGEVIYMGPLGALSVDLISYFQVSGRTAACSYHHNISSRLNPSGCLCCATSGVHSPTSLITGSIRVSILVHNSFVETSNP